MSVRSRFTERSVDNRPHTMQWLAFAAAAVALSGLFAVLIALARVPALGQLFPGAEFYRVALTLHVNLSQGVWFMAFAATLWSMHQTRQAGSTDRLLLLLAALGGLGIALSVAIGTPQPLMSNYLPVLDSPSFLSSLLLFSAALLAVSVRALASHPFGNFRRLSDARAFGLWLAAAGFVLTIGITALAAHRIPVEVEGHGYFELLFWGPGHTWQFVLVLLMMVCWVELAPTRSTRIEPRRLAALYLLAALPILGGVLLAVFSPPQSDTYIHGFTTLMQWTSWPGPVLLLAVLAWSRSATPTQPGLRLSVGLLAAGLLLGVMIDGQTTLVTAHYHGTIGSVTLSFMAMALMMLPRLGAVAPEPRWVRLQLGCYGYGILMMMLGLAGAGLMGAPRKTPGELGLLWNVETFSRILLGVGGLLATIGILMFAYLILSQLWPHALSRRLQDQAVR